MAGGKTVMIGKGENFKYYSEGCSVFAIDKKIEDKPIEKKKEGPGIG